MKKIKISKMLPRVRVSEQTHHFTIKYSVHIDNSDGRHNEITIAYFDELVRADMVAHALNFWRKTPDAAKWWKNLEKRYK